MADEDVVDFLNAWDLSQYIQIFRENEIDIKTLGLLSDDMIRELVPIIGHRAKLKTNIDQWRLIIQGMTGSSEINFETELNQNSSEEHTNLKPTLTSTTLSAENHILINLYDLGVVQQSEQQSKEVPSSLQSPTNILKAKSKLRNIETLKHLNIDIDKTKLQQEQFKAVWNTLSERKSRGETNIRIEHFSSAYSHICPSTDDLKVTIADCIDLSKIDITVQEVFLALEKCKLNSSPGPDGIPEIVLSQCRYALTLPLHYLFSLSLSSGTFPDLWKSSYVQPVFKNGDRSNIINYRPISIMSSIPKLLESILLPKLNFSFSKYIIPQQFGFRPHTSTSSNLVAYHKYLMDVIEKGGQVDAIYTDISKAFDTINHAVLIRKLELMGVNNLMLKWFSSYISCRSQKVRLHGYVSNNISIPSGVPQGGHISPLLFILYMNDVGLVFKHAQFSMFADDLKLFYNINSLDDGSKLQDDFDNFKAWCYNNGLQVNINKCNSISFYRNKSPFNIAYYSDNYLLPKVDSIKDLGVIFSSSLSFTAHIQSITIKASRSLGFIIRNTRDFNNIVSLKILYFALDDVHNLLKSTNEGKSLLASFGQSGLLDSVGRRRLCNLIINRELKDDAQKRVLSTRLQDLAYQITSVFHQERKLLDCLNNRRREYRKSGLIQTSRRSSTSSSSSSSFSLSKGLQHSVEEEDEELHSSVEEGLKWLQNSSDPWELVEKNWDITTNVRLKKLMSKNGQSIAKYMEEYPALKKPSGYLLILKDFQVSYPGKENKLYQNLIIYKNNIFELLRAKVNKTRDETVNNILNKYIKLYLEENEEISNIITLLSLSFLISVSSTRSKKSKIWRPSKIEVRDGFITHVRSDSEIQETITRRRSKLIEFGQTLQPFVIIVGHSLKEISSYLVVVDNTFYRLNSIIASVDCCFKIFLTLNAEYPVESSGIWYFIQRGLYNLKTPWDKNYTAVNAFMSDVGIRHTEDE
ncbi:unnamed protein product [Macrosiphum euphorbiae]|uniref:Reverse transcriptase domain-containing protein n=1 Tax=Macrosiphum euphorbiae TaxID=13131 RepID=A0AAV0XUW4_9HEMI|nr:unnamed protein product [Macrosiphum euphorbiae]